MMAGARRGWQGFSARGARVTATDAGLLGRLDDARALALELDRPDLVARLDDARVRFAAQLAPVAVVGEFKQGKSTLVNALLRTQVCPVDADEATAVPTLVRHGKTPEALAHLEPPAPPRMCACASRLMSARCCTCAGVPNRLRMPIWQLRNLQSQTQ